MRKTGMKHKLESQPQNLQSEGHVETAEAKMHDKKTTAFA